MASTSKSRWADTAEDVELEARLKQEKEDKRRKRAEKARQLEQQQQQQAAARAASQGRDGSAGGDDHGDRPSKRRKLTPEPGARGAQDEAAGDGDSRPPAKLLRFETGGWGATRSVENYDKLNDIEEGTYGWVARGTEKATGKVVALKRLKLEPQDRSGLPVTGLREIQILKDCSHPNIVGLDEVVVGDDLSKLDK